MSDSNGQEAPAPPPPPLPARGARPRRRGGRWWRWPGTALILLLEGILLIVAIGGSALAWRAAQGPVNLASLLPRIGRVVAVAAPQLDVAIGHLAIAWDGFTKGPDQPIRITGDAIAVDDAAQQRSIAVTHLAVDLSAAWAVRGVIAPRVVTLVDPTITLHRMPAPEGAPPPAPPPARRPMTAADSIAVLEQPPQTDQHLVKVKPAALSELRRLAITGGQVLLLPVAGAAPTARILRAGDISADVTRGAAGGLTARFSTVLSTVAKGADTQADPQDFAQTPTVSGTVTIATTGLVHLQTQARLDDPAALIAALGAPDGTPIPAMPLQATADVTTAADFSLTALKASLTGSTGQVTINGAALPVSGLVLGLSGDRDHVVIDPGSHIAFGAVSSQPPPRLALGGSAQRQASAGQAGGLAATVTLGIDHVATNDVPAYWPPKVAAGARSWISRQVHDGTLHDGAFRLGLTSGPDLDHLAVVSASGQIPATGLSVQWLPPLPPMTNVQGAIALQGPDAVAVSVASAQQGQLAVNNSSMVISGLSAADQIGTLKVNVAGPVAAAVALVSQPRLNLLKSVPVTLNPTDGTVSANLALRLPLDAKVTLAQIQMSVHAALQNLALRNILLGRSLTGGQITIDATMAKLHLAGAAALASIPTQLTVDTDFTNGPPTQVVTTLTASATADQTALAKAGIPTAGLLTGAAQFGVTLKALHSGRTDINATISLPEANLRVSQISWAGGAGQATATAHLALQGDRIVAFDGINLTGPNVAVRIRSTFAQNRLSSLIVDQLVLGRTDLHGSLGFPATSSDPYVLVVSGRALDLTGVFGTGRAVHPTVAPANNALSQVSSKSEFQPHPPWRATINLDRIIFGTMPGGASRELDHVDGVAVNNGVVVQSAQLSMSVYPSGSTAHVSIVPDVGGTRNVTVTSGDFGGLLKATNAYDVISGGALRVDAVYDDRVSNHPVSGTAEMDNFTLGNAPTVAKALAAMTLYGVVDLLHGKGLFFSKLVAPFHLADRRLDLTESRAYSASLGLTAHGSVDLPNNRFDIQGTIVPAYFFNSLLGHIPLIGKYFAPEKGGGVFAAKYELVGPIDNPQVHVNPLSLITPGFLRGMFGD
jgi:hypothetical protein